MVKDSSVTITLKLRDPKRTNDFHDAANLAHLLITMGE
jgi:hypothetical protein